MKYKRIPISAAKLISEKYDKDQVIIVTWDSVHGKTHITTYGKNKEQGKQAADGGQTIAKAIGVLPLD